MERRSRVRIPNDADVPLRVVLETAEGASREAALVDLSLEGASLCTAPDGALELELGERAELRFQSAPDGRAWVVPAWVRSVLKYTDHVRYGFAFEDPGALEDSLPTRLFRWFNRRRAERAPISPGASVGAAVRTHGEPPLPVQPIDISMTGIAILVAPERNPGYPVDTLVGLTLTLGDGDPHDLAARVRRRERTSEGVLYGLEFDRQVSPDLARERTAIRRFLVNALEEAQT